MIVTDKVSKYITELLAKLPGEQDDDVPAAAEDTEMKDEAEKEEESKPAADDDFPPIYQSGEDYDAAADAKQQAADCKASGDWAAALQHYTTAVLAAPPSALLYANRATALLKLNRPTAAERDCDLALKENPDSAKALRMRGKARKALGKFDLALQDLSAAQQIDFDEGTVEDLKFLTEKRIEAEKAEAEKRNQEEERLRKRAQEIKKAQEDAKREAQEEKQRSAAGMGGSGMPGGFPGAGMGGMPGGMPGMPGMAEMMNDPEILEGMQNPKVMAAFQELMSGPGGPMGLMSNPAKLQQLMADPEVGPFLQKLMSKFGGGGMGGMPGGMGGMPGGGMPGADNDDGDDIPDMP